jgi:3-deoxy-D-manno-octulosonic-acid transferase
MYWLWFYRVVLSCVAPFVPFYLARRARQGKEVPERLCERYGIPTVPRPTGPLAWCHAASVGELRALVPVLLSLRQQYPHVTLLLTTCTCGAASMVTQWLPPEVYHQYLPLDVPRYVRRFLGYWQPMVGCLVESECWPNLITYAAARMPVVLLSASLSDRSYRRWHYCPSFARVVMGSFRHVVARKDADVLRFRALGARHVTRGENLKYAASPLDVVEADYAAVAEACAGRLVWIGASTHESEERQLAWVHAQLVQEIPTLLTIIVPRHPARGPSIASAIQALGLKVALRSTHVLPSIETEIYIADTLGEMGLWYRLGRVVCMGGSFVPQGGHNPLEPMRLGCAVLCGPHVDNCRDVVRAATAAQALVQVPDKGALLQQLRIWLTQPDILEAVCQTTEAYIHARPHVGTQEALEVLAPFLPAPL